MTRRRGTLGSTGKYWYVILHFCSVGEVAQSCLTADSVERDREGCSVAEIKRAKEGEHGPVDTD